MDHDAKHEHTHHSSPKVRWQFAWWGIILCLSFVVGCVSGGFSLTEGAKACGRLIGTFGAAVTEAYSEGGTR